VFAGADAATVPVCAELAEASPALLVAVTFTLIVTPTCACAIVYVELVAPEMLVQASPAGLQLSHW
jgi:hypothetical protein